ncbi:MAG: hypothetical protein E7509_02085 [Ruminococcus sp.]|nr:hypothetical protein [Ruminococcus sp.]
MIIIKTLKIKDKDLITSPIRSLVRTGENNADSIIIEADRFYNGYDLSQFGFVMEGRNSADTLAVQTLPLTSDNETVKLAFTVTSDFTAVSGPLKLTLKAVNSDNNTCIIFTGGEIDVVGNPNEDCLPAEIGQQLLLQIEEAIASFEGQIQNIASEKVAEEIEKQLAGNLVKSDTVNTIVSLSQAEYDAITEPDEQTMYVILS